MTQHMDAIKTYALVFVALLVLTFLTTFASTRDLGALNTVVALGIACIKMILVALFFMHLRHSTTLTKVVVGGGLMWLAILLVLTMSDFVSRSWLPVPGK